MFLEALKINPANVLNCCTEKCMYSSRKKYIFIFLGYVRRAKEFEAYRNLKNLSDCFPVVS